MTKSFAEQLAPLQAAMTIGDQPQGVSKPRCMCHNRYVTECPGKGVWECKRTRCGASNSIGRSRCKVCGFLRGTK